jgi:hypothetical protein
VKTPSKNIVAVLVDGVWWRGFAYRGKMLLLNKVGLAGQCLRF